MRIKILLLTLFILILIFLFYLPLTGPWRTGPQAYENSNIINLLIIKDSIETFKRKYGRQPTSFKEIQTKLDDYTAFNDVLKEMPSGKQFNYLSSPSHQLGKILILGNEVDKTGLVWAITEEGVIIKIKIDTLWK